MYNTGMKSILSKIITLTPGIIIILIVAYVSEELLEENVSEALSDLVYPVAALLILAIVWLYLVPVIQAYLSKEEHPSVS